MTIFLLMVRSKLNTMHQNVFIAEGSDNNGGLPLSLMSELVEFFSFSGQTVSDIMSGLGE